MGVNADLLRVLGPELELLLPELDEKARRLVRLPPSLPGRHRSRPSPPPLGRPSPRLTETPVEDRLQSHQRHHPHSHQLPQSGAVPT